MPSPVVQAILGTTESLQVREAMLLGSHLEGGWFPPFGVGDAGHSFGPYQINLPYHPNVTRQQAEDPEWSTEYMYGRYVSGVIRVNPVEWSQSPEMAAEKAAYYAERPAQIYHQARGQATVDQAWADVQEVLGNPPPAGDSCAGIVSDCVQANCIGATYAKSLAAWIAGGCGSGAEFQAAVAKRATTGSGSAAGIESGGTGIPTAIAGGVGEAAEAVVSPITAIARALQFIFSYRFLEVIGGGLLILLGIYLLGRQLGVTPPPATVAAVAKGAV